MSIDFLRELVKDIRDWIPDVDASVIVWKIALGWAVLTTIVFMLIGVVLDFFRIRRMQDDIRVWVYTVFIVGLLGGIPAWFFNIIKIDVKDAAIATSTRSLDKAVEKAGIPPAPPSPPLPPPPPPASFQASNFNVFVQFAGYLDRNKQIIPLSQKLAQDGWNVQGLERGGERTSAAAGYNEVRYSKGNEDAAQALARTIQAQNLTSKAIGLSLTPSIPKQNLEVWISR